MKKFRIALMLIVIMGLVLASTASAQYVGSSWYTAYQVVNMGDVVTDIVVDYYDEAGNLVAAAQKVFQDVAPGSSRLVLQYTDDPNLSGGQRYSAVISAGEPVAAIVNQQLVPDSITYYNPAPPFSTYSGQGSGSASVTLPSVMYNWYGYYTEIFIMNAGTADASNVDITYIPSAIDGVGTGASGVTSLDNAIPLYASITKSQVSLSTLGATSGVYTGRFFGSASITSDQPVIAIVNQHNTSAYKLMTYNGFSTGATEIFVPTHMRGYYGYYTTLLIGNPSATETATVQITYTPAGTANVVSSGTLGAVTVSHNIPPQTSLMRYDGPPATDAQSDLDDNPVFTRFYGSVKIVSTNAVPVVAQVNVEAVQSGDDQAGSFNGIAATDATPDIVVPVILADYYGYYTNLVVQNATAVDGSCTVTYTSDSTYSSVPNHTASYVHALPASGSFTVYEGRKGALEIGDINHDVQWRSATGKLFIGAASIHCTVDAVSFVNEEKDVLYRDSMYTFNTFNK